MGMHHPSLSRLVTCALLGLGRASTSAAYETDQLSGRLMVPTDASLPVDVYVNEALERARAAAQRRIRPDWSDERVARLLRKKVYRQFPFSLHAYGAPIEGWMTHDLAKLGYAVEHRGPGTGWQDHIYDRYPKMFCMNPFEDFPTPALVFALAQLTAKTEIAPTFLGGDVRYGSDKWSHFFRLGYRYYLHSADGADPAAALRYGTKTERKGIGFVTSGAFSYADLAANHSGYLFFEQLIGSEQSTFEYENGELRLVRPFRSRDWVDESWDEYLNPSVYREHLQTAIELHLEERRDQVCAEYAQWREVNGQPRAPLPPHEQYVDMSMAMPQGDPFQLDTRCAPPEQEVD